MNSTLREQDTHLRAKQAQARSIARPRVAAPALTDGAGHGWHYYGHAEPVAPSLMRKLGKRRSDGLLLRAALAEARYEISG